MKNSAIIGFTFLVLAKVIGLIFLLLFTCSINSSIKELQKHNLELLAEVRRYEEVENAKRYKAADSRLEQSVCYPLHFYLIHPILCFPNHI